jgi:outer membrane protein OmpA-like peptidoglycan-associated protein
MKNFCFLFLFLPALSSFSQKRTELKIHFAFDKYVIRPADAASLDSLVAANAKTAQVSFELYGHCDLRGSDAYNDALALKRVKAVEEWLVKKGIDTRLISRKEGFGKRQPLSNDPGEDDQAMNRRVELVIIVPGEKPVPIEKPVEIPIEKPTAKPLERSLEKTIQDTAIKAGSKIILKNLNFYGGRDVLMPISEPALLELLQVMKNNPKLVIRIDGHICCEPGDMDGIDLATGIRNLSDARAGAVYNYLVRNGIDHSRLSYLGWGHQNPIFPYPETSERERSLNRRVEIMIVRK